MPLIRRWKDVPPLWRQAAAGTTVIVLIGGLIVALITSHSATSTATGAARDAKGAVTCVNNTLGQRNKPSAKDAAAHIAFAEADKAYDSALVTVLVTPKGPGQLSAFKAFVLAAQNKRAADLAYVKQLRADQEYRADHPLGLC